MAALLCFQCSVWYRRKGCRKLEATVELVLSMLTIIIIVPWQVFVCSPMIFIVFCILFFFWFHWFLPAVLSLSPSHSLSLVISPCHDYHHSMLFCLPWDSKRHLSSEQLEPYGLLFSSHVKNIWSWYLFDLASAVWLKSHPTSPLPLFISFFFFVHPSFLPLLIFPSAWSVYLRHWKPNRGGFVSCGKQRFHPLPSKETLDFCFPRVSASLCLNF